MNENSRGFAFPADVVFYFDVRILKTPVDSGMYTFEKPLLLRGRAHKQRRGISPGRSLRREAHREKERKQKWKRKEKWGGGETKQKQLEEEQEKKG